MKRLFRYVVPLVVVSALIAVGARANAQDQAAMPSPQATTPAAPDAASPANPNSNPSSAETVSPASTPPAEGPRRLEIGPQLGVYMPTSGKTRDRFGDNWFAIGIGLGNLALPRDRGALTLDLDLISQVKGDHHAYIVPLGLQYERALSHSGASVPYAGVSGDLVFADLRSPEDNVHSGLRLTSGGSAFMGTTLGSNAYIEARYMLISPVKTFDLSGFNLTAGLRF